MASNIINVNKDIKIISQIWIKKYLQKYT